MYKRILILFLVLLSFISYSQTVYTFGPADYNHVWKVSGQANYGIGNAFCLVTRSENTNEYGNYLYSIFFSTNSYLSNGSNCRTYIQDIDITYYNPELRRYLYPANYYRFWITVGQPTLVYTIYHYSNSLYIRVSTGEMQPTTY